MQLDGIGSWMISLSCTAKMHRIIFSSLFSFKPSLSWKRIREIKEASQSRTPQSLTSKSISIRFDSTLKLHIKFNQRVFTYGIPNPNPTPKLSMTQLNLIQTSLPI
ncbi:hypothetical protein RYX36_003386 [Vicia faba]